MNTVTPKKSLGQNFLRAPAIAEVIAKTACPKRDEVVLEIGPGEGALTDALLAHAKKVIAVEKDTRLIALLQEKYGKDIEQKKLILKEKDVLVTDVGSLVGDNGYVVAANIPYYITGAIMRHLFEARRKPKRIVLLVQKEVAERIVARNGKGSILSVSVMVFGTPRIVRTVPSGAFYPRPKVDSAIITIENIGKPFRTQKEEEHFFEIVKKGFAHKRKLLRGNLSLSKELLASCGISENARAEDVTIEQWVRLTKNI